LCCFSTSAYLCYFLFRHRLSPENFGYTLVDGTESETWRHAKSVLCFPFDSDNQWTNGDKKWWTYVQVARFEVFTAVKIQVEVFRVVTPCNVVIVYQRFGGPNCFTLHPEDKGNMDLWNVSILAQHFIAPLYKTYTRHNINVIVLYFLPLHIHFLSGRYIYNIKIFSTVTSIMRYNVLSTTAKISTELLNRHCPGKMDLCCHSV